MPASPWKVQRLKTRTMRITCRSLRPFRGPPPRLALPTRVRNKFPLPSETGLTTMMTMTIAKFWNLSTLFPFHMLLQHIRTFIQRLQLPGSAPDLVPRTPRLPRPRRLRRPQPSVPRRPRRGARNEAPRRKMRKSRAPPLLLLTSPAAPRLSFLHSNSIFLFRLARVGRSSRAIARYTHL